VAEAVRCDGRAAVWGRMGGVGWYGFFASVAGVKPFVPMRDAAGVLAAGDGARNEVVDPSVGADPLRPAAGRDAGAACGGAEGERR
jgi:hypothetical protein